MAAPAAGSPGSAGIMSWQANANAYRYAVRIREVGEKGTVGKYYNVSTTADDTRDGTMDIPIGRYVDAPGLYEFQYRTGINGQGWTPYSGYQTVAYGTSSPTPEPKPAPEPTPTPPPASDDGIISFEANANAYRYAIRIREVGAKGTVGKYYNIATTADDTSDGTVDVPVSRYAPEPGTYEFQYRTGINGQGWTPYSGYQTVTYGDKPTLMVIGDSFSIATRGLPKHLEATLDGLGYDVQVIDFARSGDTAALALGRLQSYLANSANTLPDMALIALGTNDAVQGLAPSTTKGKLDAIIDLFAARDIEVLLGEPDAYYPHRVSGAKGFDTTAEQNAFRQLYAELAAENDVVLARDFHDGLDNKTYLEGDGFHPNQSGTALMASNIQNELSALVQDYQADLAVS